MWYMELSPPPPFPPPHCSAQWAAYFNIRDKNENFLLSILFLEDKKFFRWVSCFATRMRMRISFYQSQNSKYEKIENHPILARTRILLRLCSQPHPTLLHWGKVECLKCGAVSRVGALAEPGVNWEELSAYRPLHQKLFWIFAKTKLGTHLRQTSLSIKAFPNPRLPWISWFYIWAAILPENFPNLN